MTRVLSELFGAEEHLLQQGLRRLERVSGYDSADVRLTADMLQATKRKLVELGLDAHDTTGQELYATLKQRLQADDELLVTALRQSSSSDDTVDAVAHALRTVDIERSSFALKVTVLKQLLKKQAPKQTMRQLGYRSLDSMLKHEQVSALLAAAWLLESVTWRRAFHDSYKRLKASDFETRDVLIVTPNGDRWQKLADTLTGARKHTVVALKELGVVVLLPQPSQVPPAVTTATLILALQSMNEIRAASTFLKLSQVKSNFGSIVQEVVADEPQLSTETLDQSVPWQIIQRYYARFQQAFRSEIFEPHIQANDMSWHSIEQILTSIEPSLSFWHGTDHLAVLQDGQPVSMNMLDVALAVCNDLPYDQRIVHYLRHSLWHELLLKYLKRDTVEQVVVRQMDGELATEPALI
jgi:hypothetical protein